MDLFGDEPEAIEDDFSDYEPEEKEGLLPPRESSLCLGHEEQEKRLLSLFQSGKLPHALVFSGPQGIGKATMAFRFARFLLKYPDFDPDQDSLFGDAPDFSSMDISADDPVFRQVASGGHPDLLLIERPYDATKNTTKKAVDVDAVRTIAPFLRMTSSYGGWRVVIVDDADTMNRNAQNAILKILEEPPKKTMLILVTHRAGALIPTIRSRVQTIPFQALNDSAMDQILSIAGMNDRSMISMANGSVSDAINLYESGAQETLESLLPLISDKPDWEAIHKLSDQSGKDGFEVFSRLFVWIFETAARSKARGNPLPAQLSSLQGYFQSLSLEQIMLVYETLKARMAEAEYANLDKRQAILTGFTAL